jgi:hypothetical protein
VARNTPPEKDENALHVHRLYGLYPRSEFFVMGTGPSLEGFDWSCMNERHTVALNDAVLVRGFEPLFHLFSDTGIWKRYRDFDLAERTTVVCQRQARKNFINWPGCKFKARIWQFSQNGTPDCKQPGDLFVSRTVATAGIQLAWKLGARRVYLMGVDGYRRDTHYYHDRTSKGKERRKENRLPDGRIVQDRHQAWQSNMRDLAKYFARHKVPVEVFNLSESSTIDAWPYMDMEKALASG